MSWADSVKYSGKYAATRVLHYADANDNPPATCNYDDARDCADGKCLVGAVATYTDNAGCTKKCLLLTVLMRLNSWPIFLGDITQPLHVCGRGRGGNDQKIDFDGKTVSLHASWDNDMPSKRMREDYGG
ncbi:hypothetical protein BASA83_010728 [Batrachochytrium salamandrivorans]|nr:hypothetical protein BASA83_010728 [Batrachochytrium salamandrivorans]